MKVSPLSDQQQISVGAELIIEKVFRRKIGCSLASRRLRGCARASEALDMLFTILWFVGGCDNEAVVC